MDSIALIILAAGKGTRMGQELPKVLTTTAEKPLITHVLDYGATLNPERIVVVTGYKQEAVESVILDSVPVAIKNRISFAFQQQQNGTGDAVRAALPHLSEFSGTVVILYGDVPLIKPQTLRDLVNTHNECKATITLISLKGDVSNAYGRIIRDDSGAILKITELKDCTTTEKFIDETNSGIYAVDSAFLEPAIESLSNDNAQGEYYLTDIIEKAVKEGQTVASLALFDQAEIQGVNTRVDLLHVNKSLQKRRIELLLQNDVVIEDPDSFFVDPGVAIGAGTRIGPNVLLRGATRVGSNVTIEGTACLIDTIVESNVLIRFGVRAESAHIGDASQIGPFAHLRPGTQLDAQVHIGNFVETKKARLHSGTKAGHLSYLGDCEIHKDVNIGAGTITANYDGVNKNSTTIGENVFIGSNSVLIAPINIGKGAFVGAGSTLSEDVPEKTLVLTRAARKEKKDWHRKK